MNIIYNIKLSIFQYKKNFILCISVDAIINTSLHTPRLYRKYNISAFICTRLRHEDDNKAFLNEYLLPSDIIHISYRM